jgi:serine/threonine protein kinase
VELTPGATLGPYRLVERAGVGGMAEVWRAHQPSLDRDVAIKIVGREYATESDFVARFRREALAISRLDHPHILPIYDFGEQDGFPYMVTPFVAGGTLAQRLGEPWPIDRALPILEALGSALDYAHGRGLVHRDVKPSNVLVTEHGRVVLGDFGVARMLEEASGRTQAEAMFGTPPYMSPEQAAGKPAEPASDLYSLGIVAYELLTGRVPFEAETAVAIAVAQVQKQPPPARTLNPALPESVEAALAKALAKEPDDRYQSGAALAGALAEAASGPDTEARRRAAAATVRLAPLAAAPGAAAAHATSPPTKTSAPSPHRPVAPSTRPSPSRPRLSYAGLLALAGLGVALFAAVVLVSNLLSSAQPSTSAARPTPTVAPTNTPQPTSPAVAVAPTPEPTQPPPPTATAPPPPTATPVPPPTMTPAPKAPTPTAAPPPKAPTPVPPTPKPPASGLEPVLQADRARVASLGFAPGEEAVTSYNQENLIAIKGSCGPSCQQVFFFVNNRYLGTDTLRTSTSIGEIAPAGPGRIRVTYTSARPAVPITYTWNGQRLIPDGTPPGH